MFCLILTDFRCRLLFLWHAVGFLEQTPFSAQTVRDVTVPLTTARFATVDPEPLTTQGPAVACIVKMCSEGMSQTYGTMRCCQIALTLPVTFGV